MSVAPDALRGGESVTYDQQFVSRRRVTLTASYTRPSDTTAYATGDTVNNSTSAPVILTFSAAARYAAGSGRIVGAKIQSDSAAGTKGDFELWLFSSSITMQNDNAAFGPSDAEVRNCLGILVFGNAPIVGSGNEIYRISEGDTGKGLPLSFVCGASLTDLYGVLVVRSAYTPANAGVIQIQLDVEQD